MDFIELFKKLKINEFTKFIEEQQEAEDIKYNSKTKKFEDVIIFKNLWFRELSYIFDLFTHITLSNTIDYKEKIHYLLDNNYQFELEHLNNYKVNIFIQTVKIIINDDLNNYINEIKVFIDYYTTKNKFDEFKNIIDTEIGHVDLFEKYDSPNMKQNLLKLYDIYKKSKDKNYKLISKIIYDAIYWYKKNKYLCS
jgi:hypothetical protein